MAPPKWTVFDGIDDAEEEDSKTGETNDTAGNADGEEALYEVPEASTSGDLETADFTGEREDGVAGQKEGEDPKEGDGDKPDKKELLVCAGAMCTCTQAVSPTPVALKVQMQDTYSINDPDGTIKYLATDKEVDKSALDFVQCKFPDPSKPRPCTTQLVWKDFYEHMVLPGGAHPLTFKSTAVCTVGTGQVAFQTTGQQSTVTPEQVEAANSAGWPQENPILEESPADVELEKDESEGDQKGVGVLAIKAKTAGPYPVGVTITFEATKLSPTKKTYTAAELQGINWNVYDASLKPCGQAIDGGRETDIKFNKAGRFTVEGYGVTAGGNSKDAKSQKRSAVATLTIEENKLAGVQRKGGSGSTEYRFEEPAVYDLTTRFPVEKTPLPRRQTLENVVWTVVKKAGAGDPVLVAAGGSATVTCTAPCDYVVIATLGETAQSSPRMKAIKNAVTAVTASLKSCRLGEEVVLKAKFKIEPALPAELALLKWTCKDGKGVEHKEGLVFGSREQRLRLKPVGHYKVWAFVNSPSKTVVTEFEVTQPKVKLVQWVYPDKETGKKMTGWEEDNWVQMVFESAQGLGAEATVGVLRDNAFHPIMKPVSFTVGKDNEDSFHFVLSKEHFKGKVKEGDYLTVRINCTTPGQSIAGGATHMLQFTEKEGLGGTAFYKGKEKVNQAHYGDTLRCRVYGRNLSAGKAAVIIGRFESLGGNGPQVPLVIEEKTVVIGESGYGEFDFFLDVNKAKGTKSTIHKFGAWIQEAEVGGKHVFIKPEEAKGIQMLFVQVPVGVGSGAPSEAGIEKGDNAPADGTCVCKDYDLVWGSKVSCEFRRKVVEISKNIGLPQENNEGANWLMTVMALETAYTFSPTIGTFGDKKNEAKSYTYVGLIQFGKAAAEAIKTTRSNLISLTAEQQLEFVEKYFLLKRFKGILVNKTALYLAVNYPTAAPHHNEKNYIVYGSSKDAYDDNKLFKREEHEFWIDKKGEKHYYEGRKGNSYIWEFDEALNEIENSGKSRKAKTFNCTEGGTEGKYTKSGDVASYHIYADGRIEKLIPQRIKSGYENKYKYIYHDAKEIEHEVCVADWHRTREKGVGKIFMNRPSHSKIMFDERVSEGNTSRRVKYENGDVAEYGLHPTKGLIWLLYVAGKSTVDLLKMPDSLTYVKDGINISYEFTTTQRRYTGADSFAGFIGYLAKSCQKVKTTGSCFSEGSSFPSQEHCNGRSIDTLYIGVLEKDQNVINCAMLFHFTEILVGSNDYCKKLRNAGNGGILHNTHLHAGNFDGTAIKIVKIV